MLTAGWPKHINLQVTGRCNAHCMICDRTSPGAPAGRFGWNISREVLDAVKPLIIHAETLDVTGYGEFLLSPFADEILQLCADNMTDVFMASNGLMLADKMSLITETIGRLGWLTLSIQSHKPDKNDRLMGMPLGSFEKIKNIIKAQNLITRYMVVSHTVHNENVDDLAAFIFWCGDMEIRNIQIQHIQILRPEHKGLSLFYRQDIWNEARARVAEILSRPDFVNAFASVIMPPAFGEPAEDKQHLNPRNCPAPHNQIHIDQDGNVRLCCFADWIDGLNVKDIPADSDLISDGRIIAIQNLFKTDSTEPLPDYCARCPEHAITDTNNEASFYSRLYEDNARLQGEACYEI